MLENIITRIRNQVLGTKVDQEILAKARDIAERNGLKLWVDKTGTGRYYILTHESGVVGVVYQDKYIPHNAQEGIHKEFKEMYNTT